MSCRAWALHLVCYVCFQFMSQHRLLFSAFTHRTLRLSSQLLAFDFLVSKKEMAYPHDLMKLRLSDMGGGRSTWVTKTNGDRKNEGERRTE